MSGGSAGLSELEGAGVGSEVIRVGVPTGQGGRPKHVQLRVMQPCLGAQKRRKAKNSSPPSRIKGGERVPRLEVAFPECR